MATKLSKSTVQRIIDTIGELVRQPLSDESNEVPTIAAVRRSERVAAGSPRGKAKKTTKKKATTKKKSAMKKRATGSRKTKKS